MKPQDLHEPCDSLGNMDNIFFQYKMPLAGHNTLFILHFWDQHVSPCHPDKNCPPAGCILLPNCSHLQILKRVGRNVEPSSAPYKMLYQVIVAKKKKFRGNIGYPKTCRNHSELSKRPRQRLCGTEHSEE